MAGSLRNKLFRYEAAPPSDVWARIAQELDATTSVAETAIASKLTNISIAPPPGAWKEIESILDGERKSPARVIPLVYKRIAVAVIAIAAVALTVLYLYSGDDPVRSALMAKTNPDIKTKMLPVPSPAAAIAVKTPAFSGFSARTANRFADTPEMSSPNEETDIFTANDEVHFANLQPVDASQPVTVPAMPLRDANGNIILDENLIRQPNDPYITITSPNGSQTKISSKFIGILRYLNGNAVQGENENNNDGLIWKDKFQAWRDKLLNEDSFIPAANNFFDIFEMKDIIEE